MRHIELPDIEFRRHPRYVFSGTMHLVGNHGARMEATDLSLNGLQFRSPSSLGQGNVVEVSFLLYNVRVKGIVRHVVQVEGQKGWMIGVEFETPQPELLKTAISMTSASS